MAYLDDDDEWKYNKIEAQVETFEKCKENVAIVYCNNENYYDDKKVIKTRLEKNIKPKTGKVFNELLVWNFIGSCSFPLIRKSAIAEVNGFSENMPAMQDLELYLRIAQKYEVEYCDKILATYHIYSGDRISKKTEKREKAYENLKNEFVDNQIEDKHILYKFYCNGIKAYTRNCNRKKAVEMWRKNIKLFPIKFDNVKMLLFIIIRPIVKKYRSNS